MPTLTPTFAAIARTERPLGFSRSICRITLASFRGGPSLTPLALAFASPDLTLSRIIGGISKQGDGYLRRLLVVGATAVMSIVRKDAGRQPVKIATVALANKSARIAWAVMSRNEVYVAPAA